MPLISIIIPCFNYGKYLFLALEDLKKQIFQDWECLIIDDGSSDNTKEVAEGVVKEDSRFRYIYQENKGVSAARNNGIRHSRGVYIQFLDADDLLEKHKLDRQVQLFKEYPTLDIVYSSARYFHNSNPQERLYFMGENDAPWIPEFSGPGRNLLTTMIRTNIMAMHCPLIKKEAILKVGYFNESLKYLEDWEYWFRCAVENLNFFYCNLPDTFALVRVHGDSVSNKKWQFRFAEFELKRRFFQKFIGESLSDELGRDIWQLQKRLVGFALVDLLKGNFNGFTMKIKQITCQKTFLSGLQAIAKERLWPVLSWRKIVKGGKALLT